MQRCSLLASLVVSFVFVAGGAVSAGEGVFAYPYYLLDAYNPENDCWKGMGADGIWPVPVVPGRWLVGRPPSDVSGVTVPVDHWVELQFRGQIVDGPGHDIFLIEWGRLGEQALVLITDGYDQEYLLDVATASDAGGHLPTEISFDVSGISLPFSPRAIRLVALDLGGGSPGFDVGNVRARISSSCGDTACNPDPADGARDVYPDAVLSWSPGRFADQHAVYFGLAPGDIDLDAVSVYDVVPLQDANTYDPCGLELGKTYYWRIAEVNEANAESPWIGDLWSFTAVGCIVVDDFESYDGDEAKLYDNWRGIDQAAISVVERDANPVHNCFQSMYFYYYYDSVFYSEAVRTFTVPQDWISGGVKALEVFFHGTATNEGSGQMYVAISDGDANTVIPYSGHADDLQKEVWQNWRIDLQNLAGVDLGRVESISIGFRTSPSEPAGFGTGVVYFDDIVLCGSRCLPEHRCGADLNADCSVDFADLDRMTAGWLDRSDIVDPIVGPNTPLAWYKFDGDPNDSVGTAHGRPRGNPSYAPGVYGQAISFDGDVNSVSIPGAADLFSGINAGITIAFWQYGADSAHRNDTVCCSNYEYGVLNPTVAINLGCWRDPGRYNWDCGRPWSFGGRLSGEHQYKSEWAGQWNHWAFTKDTRVGSGSDKGRMQIFLNGRLHDSRTGTTSPITGIDYFEIGSGWYGGYDGLIDDFRIYDYALSEAEVAHVATDGTGVFSQPAMSPADLDADDDIDFGDFAILADSWLEEQFWP
ncbi:MAG: LamG domain-containing protein [Phycisphaerales bacterium]|nr:MAG: LamG domain-containing protein [Phycisphaerales bacterium]